MFLAIAQAHLYHGIRKKDAGHIQLALQSGANLFDQQENGMTPFSMVMENLEKHGWSELHKVAISGEQFEYNRLSARFNPHQEAKLPLADFKLILAVNGVQDDNLQLNMDEKNNICITAAELAKIKGLNVNQNVSVTKTNLFKPKTPADQSSNFKPIKNSGPQ